MKLNASTSTSASTTRAVKRVGVTPDDSSRLVEVSETERLRIGETEVHREYDTAAERNAGVLIQLQL